MRRQQRRATLLQSTSLALCCCMVICSAALHYAVLCRADEPCLLRVEGAVLAGEALDDDLQ